MVLELRRPDPARNTGRRIPGTISHIRYQVLTARALKTERPLRRIALGRWLVVFACSVEKYGDGYDTDDAIIPRGGKPFYFWLVVSVRPIIPATNFSLAALTDVTFHDSAPCLPWPASCVPNTIQSHVVAFLSSLPEIYIVLCGRYYRTLRRCPVVI